MHLNLVNLAICIIVFVALVSAVIWFVRSRTTRTRTPRNS